MVKVAAPCFSLSASGSVGGALTFSNWRGIPYVRGLVKPANPKTGPQTGVRAMFKFLAQIWNGLTDADKATWETMAKQMNAAPFNAFMRFNQRRWRDFNTPSKQTPAAEVSTPPDGLTGVATPDVRSITLALTHGTALAAWGVAIFRNLTGTFSMAFSNCIAVIAVDGSGDAEYVDSPLAPGTYYYNSVGFNADGIEGADGTEFSGIVT